MATEGHRLPVLKGRGTPWNPPNRFERLHLDREGWTDPDDPPPQTQLLNDASRSILAYNDSPDVGFDAGLNPYRGCEHACAYCLAPETPVLYADMTWRPIGEVQPGHLLVGFDEYPVPGKRRKLRPARVEAVVESRKRTTRVVTDEGEVLTTAEHRWLQDGNFRWSRTEQLGPGRRLRRLPVEHAEPMDDDYQAGYLAGLTLGDGTMRYEPGQRSETLGHPQPYWRVAMKDVEPLYRAIGFLKPLGIHLAPRTFSPGRGLPPLMKVETRSYRRLETLHPVVTRERASRSYRRGFVAGFFDAEGHNGSSLRMTQVDPTVLDRVQRYGRSLGLEFTIESFARKRAGGVRLVGSVAERMRFFALCQPAIRRESDPIFGYMPPTSPDTVRAIEPGPEMRVIDIQTSTGTFFAAGMATHNCYARPTHEYLGFSAGLDFETKILVKRDAPELLRKALSSKSWRPQVIGLSGNTDAYQPAERRLRVTRRCLEVLAEFRNPVQIVTKSYLVTRDVDILAELAEHQAVSVVLSVTSLDPEVQRVMEPRAAIPARRLGAIRVLTDAGIPVGVNVAPVVPGLTDHEMPAILEAAAEAGATHAGYILLRLPHGVKEIFSDWLGAHFPDRKQKVLNRVREMRGGKLYDARFEVRGRGEGPWADQLRTVFRVHRERLGLERPPELSIAAFKAPPPPPPAQTDLFAAH